MAFTLLSRCLAVICLLVTLTWSRDIFTLVGSRGVVDPKLSSFALEEYPLSLHRWIAPGSSLLDTAILILSISMTIAAVLTAWRPRSFLAALFLFTTFVAFKQTFALIAYGMFEYVHLGLFYVLVANGAKALSAWRGSGAEADLLVGVFARVHIAMTYFLGGVCKAIGPHWWNGESLWRAIGGTDSTGQRWISGEGLGHFPVVLQVAGIGVVALETLYPLAFIRRARPIVVGGAILMHFGTIVFQGLTLFGLTMIALNLFFWFESQKWDAGKALVSPKVSQ